MYDWQVKSISFLGCLTVRTLAVLFLAGLIFACPLLCGAVEDCQVAERAHSDGSPSHAPAHCPEDGDDCVCRGAVQATDVRVPHGDVNGLPALLQGLVGILAHSPAHSLAHLTSDGTPTGLAGWGTSLTVRAVLQNFRC